MLSVIIPTRNQEHYLRGLLQSLEEQEPIQIPWEVLVIDNNSEDNTRSVVSEFSEKSSHKTTYFLEPNIGLHNARNRGALEAKGEFVALLDDDMTLAKTWLSGINLLLENQSDAVVGKILPSWEVEPEPWLLELYEDGVMGHLGLIDLGDETKSVPSNFIFGGNSFLRKTDILTFGGFHPDSVPQENIRLRGDGETGLLEKFAENNFRCHYAPSAIAYHIIPERKMTKEYYLKRCYNEGISYSFSFLRKKAGACEEGLSLAKGHLRKLSLVKEKTIKQEARVSFWYGFIFHHLEVKKDLKLLDYVMQKSYFPEKIPE